MNIWQTVLFLLAMTLSAWRHLHDQKERREEKQGRLRAEKERDEMEWKYVQEIAKALLKERSPSVIDTTVMWDKTPVCVIRTGYENYPFVVATHHPSSSYYSFHPRGIILYADREDVAVNDLIASVQAMDALVGEK